MGFAVESPETEPETTVHPIHSLTMMGGEGSRGNILVYLQDRADSDNRLYFIESSMVYPSEIKAVVLPAHNPTDLKLWVPLSLDDVRDVSKTRVVGVTATPTDLIMEFSHPLMMYVFCPCPQYCNGDILMPSVKSFFISGANGDPLHVWYLPPVTMKEGEKVPLV